MKCSEKERESCNVEKRGCEGCFYNKDKIEIGEYIRTNKGSIDKVINNKYYMPQYIECEHILIARENIIKHSKNIIDLIEVGDFVNGLEVYKGKVASGKERLLARSYMISGMALEVVNIKTIVTKEQFASVEYKV